VNTGKMIQKVFLCELQKPTPTAIVLCMIRAKGIHKSYGDLHILKGVDLEIKKVKWCR
jgi:hypothetical protein